MLALQVIQLPVAGVHGAPIFCRKQVGFALYVDYRPMQEIFSLSNSPPHRPGIFGTFS
jgi:hypothetical protein